MGRPGVFLDRDGTLNREVDYLSRPEQVELLPGVPAALRRLKTAGFVLVVVTNQSGIARGLLTEPTLAHVHARLRDLLAAEDIALDHVTYCPHHPTIGLPALQRACACRKPAPGMLLDSARALDLDLGLSWTVGDSARDIEAGAAAGTRCVLVRTGKGEQELARLRAEGQPPEHVASDLSEAAALIDAEHRPT